MANQNTKKKSNSSVQKASAAEKVAASRQAQPKRKKKRASLREYFKGVRLEMKKVVWPTRGELSSYTGLVLVSVAFFAVAFWAIDSGVLAALKGVLGITMAE